MIICSKISSMIEGDADQHQMVLDDNGQTLGQLGDPAVAKKAELDLHEQIQSRFAEKGGAYADSFRAVMHDPKNTALAQAYMGWTHDRYEQQRARPDPDMTSLEAGREIDKRVKAYTYDHPGTTYPDAMSFVMGANPELEATYRSYQ